MMLPLARYSRWLLSGRFQALTMTSSVRGSREMSGSPVAMGPIERVTVIGSGLMGSGIAQVNKQCNTFML